MATCSTAAVLLCLLVIGGVQAGRVDNQRSTRNARSGADGDRAAREDGHPFPVVKNWTLQQLARRGLRSTLPWLTEGCCICRHVIRPSSKLTRLAFRGCTISGEKGFLTWVKGKAVQNAPALTTYETISAEVVLSQ